MTGTVKIRPGRRSLARVDDAGMTRVVQEVSHHAERTLGNPAGASVLGFGGFHLCEIPTAIQRVAERIPRRGRPASEPAASYGDGCSEIRIERAVAKRRDEYVLATKSRGRTAAAFAAEIDRSLANLLTDHVDVVSLHGIQTPAEVDRVLAPGGALEAAVAARQRERFGSSASPVTAGRTG